MPKIVQNDSVVLVNEKGKKILLTVINEVKRIKGLGVYSPGELIGKNFGDEIAIGNKKYMILTPSISDKISSIERKAQIILPKDGMFIIFYCDIKSGDKVVECGSGSGALTILLANFVRPKGKVISYEKRNEFLKIAKKNVENAGLIDYVEFKYGDVTQKISEKKADSVILDIPNPQDALNNVLSALKLGGHLATYLPTINQVEKAVRKMRNLGFAEIKTIETLQREIIVGERGVRPSFDALGHTGYVTFGRKVTE